MSGTTANLPENAWIKLKDTYYALMLPSGNDASVTLAEYFGTLLKYV